ncbi:MAG: ATP-binding protein [Bacilli bacterium]|nr:ATP-binding protein [Bacilli bacterium]MBO6284712.1 ATP-binding protein [Bacilli bacterium]
MLISFKIRNFLSFKAMTSFSMVGGRVKRFENRLKTIDDKLRVLTFSAIYGPNAAGKSSFVSAVREFGYFVLRNSRSRFANYSFRGNKESSKQPTYFEATFVSNDTTYVYGFEYAYETNDFISEWLYKIVEEKEKRIFERDITSGVFEFDGRIDDKDQGRFSVILEDLKLERKKLFTNYLHDIFDKVISPDLKEVAIVYDWVNLDLEVTLPNEDLTTPDYFLVGSKLNELSALLTRFGTGIKKLSTQRLEPLEVREAFSDRMIQSVQNSLNENLERVIYLRSDKNFYFASKNKKGKIEYNKVLFVHDFDGDERTLTMGEESDGTIRIMQLAPILLTKETNKTFFVDEFDRCLHPLLSVRFVREFMELAAGKNMKNQLIITTHESLLMDLELLRRDEIWFVEKKAGSSEMYSLDEFQERFDKKIDKNYLIGRYGSVPQFQETMGEICTDEGEGD